MLDFQLFLILRNFLKKSMTKQKVLNKKLIICFVNKDFYGETHQILYCCDKQINITPSIINSNLLINSTFEINYFIVCKLKNFGKIAKIKFS